MSQTIIVTGGAGHVGSHVVEQLAQDPDNRIIVVDNYFNGSHDNEFSDVEYREGHTKDISSILRDVPDIDIVYHLGEYARIAPSFEDHALVADMNIRGTLAVVELWKERGFKLVYAASSTKFALQGEGRHQNPYSLSKAGNVDLVNGYGKWFSLPYAITYFYNAFGERENGKGKYATLIAKFEQAHLNNKPLTVVKPGTQKRNFTYAGDLARGIILAGQKGNGDGYALANPGAYSILEIAETFGGPVELIDGYPGRPESGDISTKAYDELGWKPTVKITDYIRDFIAKHPRGS